MGAQVGERITWPGHEGSPDEQLADNKKITVWPKIQEHFRTSADRVAMFKDAPFTTTAGVCVADTVVDGTIS
eukprot:GDKH01013114.1.p3 GENE.GDKH01013114.1~~GDKH01013114.1.p3  ORF type:complete len:72 (-),score=25.42 GDKH01013114.1:110-325(-)